MHLSVAAVAQDHFLFFDILLLCSGMYRHSSISSSSSSISGDSSSGMYRYSSSISGDSSSGGGNSGGSSSV